MILLEEIPVSGGVFADLGSGITILEETVVDRGDSVETRDVLNTYTEKNLCAQLVHCHLLLSAGAGVVYQPVFKEMTVLVF